jgi:hypothetical protein
MGQPNIYPASEQIGVKLPVVRLISGAPQYGIPDMGGNFTGPARIDRMMSYFRRELGNATNSRPVMDIDIVGFSRGAAQARDFANRITARRATLRASRPGNPGNPVEYLGEGLETVRNSDGTNTYYFYYKTGETYRDPSTYATMERIQRRCVNFRFMGLFDTVLSASAVLYEYEMGIPSHFRHVSHATALNEYRAFPVPTASSASLISNIRNGWNVWTENGPRWDATRTHIDRTQALGNSVDNSRLHYGGFPLESIGQTSSTPGMVRTEVGFIGAHADIGGGYGQSDSGLSSVAMSWMVSQARAAGVAMNWTGSIDMGNPVIHDQSNAIRWGNPTGATRAQATVAPVVSGAAPRLIDFMPEDRAVHAGARGRNLTQRGFSYWDPRTTSGIRSMPNADSHEYINYTSRSSVTDRRVNTNDLAQIVNLRNATGTVNMQRYMAELRSRGIVLPGIHRLALSQDEHR